MKKLKLFTSMVIFTAILFYLIGVFMEASFNLAEWNESIRHGIGATAGFISVIAIMVTALSMEKDSYN